jgi:long-chain acyl-CoA synthetase
MLPLAHAYARTSDLGTWLVAGGQLAVVDGLEPFLRWLPIVRPHLVNTVPLVIDRLIAEAGNGSVRDLCGENLRWLGCGGAPLSAASFQRLSDEGIAVIQGYGMTETSPVICSATPFDGKPNCVGKPVDGGLVRIDEQGELWYRGPGLMQGYLDERDEVAEGALSRMRDGWFRTGDLATMDPEGQIRIRGRADELLVLASAHKVHPVELERVILADRRIEQVVVFADRRGLGAFVWPRNENETAESLNEVIATALKDRYWYEQIRSIIRLPRPLTVADGELTVKGSPRRELIQHRYLSERT